MPGRDLSVRIIGLLGGISSGVALYLAKEHYHTGPSICDRVSGGAFSCSSVNQSEYSEFLGVPVAVFGAIWGAVLCYGSWRLSINDRVAYFITAILLWSSLGLLFIVYMVYAEFVLGSICIFCTIIHVLSIIIFYHAFRMYTDLGVRPSAGAFLYSLRHPILGIFVLCILPVFLFNMRSPSAPPFTLSHADQIQKGERTSGENYLTDLAQCIASRGIKMFGSDSCGNCRRQKSIFGEAFHFIDYIDCSKTEQRPKCDENKIGGYPTWIIYSPTDSGVEQTRHPGVMQPKDLEKFADCILSE